MAIWRGKPKLLAISPQNYFTCEKQRLRYALLCQWGKIPSMPIPFTPVPLTNKIVVQIWITSASKIKIAQQKTSFMLLNSSNKTKTKRTKRTCTTIFRTTSTKFNNSIIQSDHTERLTNQSQVIYTCTQSKKARHSITSFIIPNPYQPKK